MSNENNDNIVQEQEVSDASSKNVLDSESSSSSELQQVSKKKKGKKGLLTCIILLLLCSIAGSGYYYFNLKDKAPNKIDNETKKYTSDYQLSGNDLSDFDLSFLKLENEEKNKIYSPLSIKYALEMLAEGAKGDSKAQIDAVIGKYNAKSYPNSEHMSFANAMFIRDSYKDKVNENYSNKIKSKYGAEVILDPFASPDNINGWVSNKTLI